MTWTLLSILAAVFCYTVSQLHMHKKGKWIKKGHGFFGENSDLAKYHNQHADKTKFQVAIPLNNLWYYDFFRVKYREAFPLSATMLSFVTDFYHLSQAGFKIFLALSFVPLVGWIWAGVIWVCWGIFFTIFYKILSR